MNGIYRIDDTICAPATSSGGAISIVRVSGPDCFRAVDKVVGMRRGDAAGAAGFSLHFGVVEGLDEVLVSIFRAPHSYTGEDMAEISCHASPYVVAELVRRLCEAGCRPAEAGEFTRRAFTAGKLDLSQAEAVADLIAADSMATHKLAFSQLRGAYSHKLRQLRGQLTELAALLELELDFSEEDLEFANRDKLAGLSADALAECRRLSDSFRLGNAFKKGIPVAIVGAVNSGKSTLLNALLGEERAIVSDVPGTTRDTVEELLSINGVSYRLIDTAGIRETQESVERMGIERSFDKLDGASVVVIMLDGTALQAEWEEIERAVGPRIGPEARVIRARNKTDLLDSPSPLPGVLDISALTGAGMDALKNAISADDAERLKESDGALVSNARHCKALENAASCLERFSDGLSKGLGTELLAEDLREALSELGDIFGEVTHFEITDVIFKRFCIGK